jgi:hypothetical protein
MNRVLRSEYLRNVLYFFVFTYCNDYYITSIAALLNSIIINECLSIVVRTHVFIKEITD